VVEPNGQFVERMVQASREPPILMTAAQFLSWLACDRGDADLVMGVGVEMEPAGTSR
jgi:hypothetical protein